MEIAWTATAKKAWYKAVTYCEEQFGRYAADRFAERTAKVNELLRANPYLGKQEPLLEKCSLPYRSLVLDKHYKIIYCVEDTTIRVIRLWDTRREPAALVRHIK